MDDESAFLTAILRNPFDDAPRLIYADWLDERDDPRGEYLRIECELGRTWSYTEPQYKLLGRLERFRKQFDPDWIADVHRCTTPPPPLDVAAIVPEMKPLARTAVRLHPRQGEVARDASKSGGVFLWPRGKAGFLWPRGNAWPRCEQHSRPLSAVLQLRKDEFPEINFRAGADILQILVCPGGHKGGLTAGVHAQWWNAADIDDPVEEHPMRRAKNGASPTPRPCRFYPERVIEYPHPRDLDPELYRRVIEAPEAAATAEWLGEAMNSWKLYNNSTEYLYGAWLSIANGMKIGGHGDEMSPKNRPKCACGGEMDLLASMPHWEWGYASWGRWLAIEDRNAVTADPDVRHRVLEPQFFDTRATWFVYMCSRCETRPIVVYSKEDRR